MKTWKNLIIPAAVLTVLIIILAVYNFALKDKLNPQDESTAETSALGYVVNYQAAGIKGIHVLKKDGSGYSVTANGTGTDGTPVWAYASDKEDISGDTFSQTKLTSFTDVLSSVDIIKSIPDAGDSLAEYGLDKPIYTVTYTLVSGEVHTLLYGSTTFDGSDVYCTLDDTGTVYTTNAVEAAKCDSSLIDFLDLAITSAKASDVAIADFKRTEDKLDLVTTSSQVSASDAASPESGWEVTSPFKIEASSAFGKLMDSVLALTASEFADLNPKDYTKYGLDNPAYTFDILFKDGKKLQIQLSKDMGGIYYGVTSDSPRVFSLGTSTLTGLQTPLIELISPFLTYQLISDVKNIDASFPDGVFSMGMNVAKGGGVSDKDSVVTINGLNAKVADNKGRSYFALLYEGIIGMSVSDFDLSAKPVNTKDVTITITLKTGKQTIINLAVKDENTYYAFIDGEYHGFLISKDDLYKDNGANLYDYGIWAAYNRLLEAIAGDDGSGVYVISDS